MGARTFAAAPALGALLLLASGASVRAADDGPGKKPSLSFPSSVYKGTVESVTPGREPGMHTRVVIRTWWRTVECWITPKTELSFWLCLTLSKGSRVEARIDDEGNAVWIRRR